MIKNKNKSIEAQELIRLMRQIGGEQISVDDDGEILTKAHQLISLLWKMALGYTERLIEYDPHAPGEKKIDTMKVHSPNRWAMEVILSYLEGKPQNSAGSGESTTAGLLDHIEQVIENNINEIAKRAGESEQTSISDSVSE